MYVYVYVYNYDKWALLTRFRMRLNGAGSRLQG